MTKIEWQSLWRILWRVVLVGPVLWLLGLGWMLLVLAAFVAPPILAVGAFLNGSWFSLMSVLAIWLVALRFGRPVLRWTFQGIEWASF
jgi:hypothetical protein